ncbi:MAG: hypothetical protein DDT37_01643 [Firmicutes bacterium]|nr:hypothetical protein [candidate division NPL-UPA2 bacterium]
MSRHTEIADAVIRALNGRSFSLAFTAVRKSVPMWSREELSTLRVMVIPSTYSSEIQDRGRRTSLYSVDIAVQRAVDPASLSAVDALLDLLDEIDSFLSMKRLLGFQAAMWTGVETVAGAEAMYAPEHLEGLRVFTGVLRVTWRMVE